MLAKHALSQLSYGPVTEQQGRLAEPKLAATSPPSPHSALKTRINALNGLPRDSLARYASEGWWAWEDLNFRPHAYQARALTN